jgi:lipopolysaccharide transport protein LptA
MSRRRWPWTKILRVAVLAALAVIGTIVVSRVVDRLLHKNETIDRSSTPLASSKVEVRDKVSFVEFRGDRSKVEAKFDKQYRGADGLNHLEGHVLIVDRGKAGGRELRLAGEAATYEDGWTRVHVQGAATVQFKGLTVASTEFDYDKATETVRSSAGVRAVSSRVSGTARKLAYAVEAQEIVFEDSLDFTVVWPDSSQPPVHVTGGRLLYNLAGRRGFVEGEVTFARGNNRGRAGLVQFELFPENDNFSRIDFQGAVEIDLEDRQAAEDSRAAAASPRAAGFTDFIFFRAERQTIRAGQAILIPFDKTNKIQAFLLRGGSAVRFLTASGNTTDLSGETIEYVFTPEGELRDFTVEGNPRITGFHAATNETTTIEGVKVFYEDREMRVTGTADRPAKFEEPSRSIAGGILAFYFRLNSFDAARYVSIRSTPRAGERGTSGFFTGNEPVFIWADAVRHDDATKSFWMSGRVRMAQGRESLFIREMTILDDTGEVHGRDDVVSTFIHKSKNKDKAREERIMIEASTLDFDPNAQKICYGGRTKLGMEEVTVRADVLTVDLAEGEIQKIDASRNVAVDYQKGARKAAGERAIYDAAAETIVLTGGRPTITDPVKGSVAGEKLTFFLADGKIEVEDKAGGKTLTVIK